MLEGTQYTVVAVCLTAVFGGGTYTAPQEVAQPEPAPIVEAAPAPVQAPAPAAEVTVAPDPSGMVSEFEANSLNDPNAYAPGYAQAEDGSWVPESFYAAPVEEPDYPAVTPAQYESYAAYEESQAPVADTPLIDECDAGGLDHIGCADFVGVLFPSAYGESFEDGSYATPEQAAYRVLPDADADGYVDAVDAEPYATSQYGPGGVYNPHANHAEPRTIQAEDGTYVPESFYDRTDYNRNGITDQEEGYPPNPNPADVY